MQTELSGKMALVTGSSSGIGRAIAEALHRDGCRVALNGRQKDKLVASAMELFCPIVLAGDVTKPEEARRIIAEAKTAMGRLDILVCNVGSGQSVSPGEESFEEWQRMFALNFLSATNMIEAAREMLVASRGVIVCISSICGSEVVPGAPVTYSVAKAALHAYVRGIARPLGKQGVRINAVAPGNILFDGSVWSKKLTEDANGVQQMLDRDVALGRLGSPQDVANLVVYLASSQAGFATGGVWTLDGGQVRS